MTRPARRNRFLLFALLALVFACVPAAAGKQPERLIVGGGDSFRPTIFLNEQGEPDGIHVELWRLWSQKTGVDVQFKLMDWSLVLPALLAGEIDVAEGVSFTPERAEILDFSKPYDEMPAYIFFHETLYGVKGLDDIEGFPVGVLRGTSVQAYLEEHGKNLRLILYDNPEQIIDAALDGRIRVFVSEEPTISFYFSRAGSWGGFRRAQKPLLSSDLRVAVRKGDTAMLALVEQGMSQITPQDKRRIEKKWSGTPLAPHMPWKWILLGLGVILALICGVILWNTQLRRRIATATRTLRRSEERFLQVAAHAHEWFWEVDAGGLFTYCSPAALDISGYTPDELEGKIHFFDLFHEDELEETKARAMRLFQEIKRFQDFISHNKSKTGQDIWLSTAGVELTDEQDELTGFRGVSVDITEKRKNERELEAHRERLEELVEERTAALKQANEQLLQSQKMEAIGVLAGGIAHDFNNILATISGTAEFMQKKAGPDAPGSEHLRRILRSCRRARDLTMKLLTFARREKLDIRTVTPNQIVSDVVDMLRTLPGYITVQTRLAGDLPHITVDRNQISQALLNICLNASDAIEDTGVMTIETYKTEWEHTGGDGPAPGTYCAIRVTDTGRGIDPEIRDKIFEPFFTTKARGKGTGLGLSVTLGIIQNHGGHINISDGPDGGAAFEILIPAFDEQQSQQDPNPATNPPGTAMATLLAVDDDIDFLEMVRENLEDLGFEVLCAGDGAQALDTFNRREQDIDLVILDMLMPDMDGGDVFHALLGLNPDVKVIICSGYSKDGKASSLLDAGACGFIQKPFDFRDLAKSISEIIES